MKRTYVTWSDYVDMEIDLAELVKDLTNEELANVGLMRIPEGVQPPTDVAGGMYEPQPSIVEHKMLCAMARAKVVAK